MGLVIESLTVNVSGKVVKNNDSNGDTVLRMSQDQAREIFDDLSTFFAKNAPSDGQALRLPETPSVEARQNAGTPA